MRIYLKNSTGATCKVCVNSGGQSKDLIIESAESVQGTALDIVQNEFDVFISLFYDLCDDFENPENKSLKDKVLTKLSKKFVGVIDNLAFKVDCAYHLTDINDGEIIDITSPIYFFGIYDVLGFLEFLPMEYVFPKLSLDSNRAKLVFARGQNREAFLKHIRRFGIVYYGMTGLWKLPLQYHRVKHLSKENVVYKKLEKFLKLPPEEQDKLLKKQSNMLEKY